MSHGLQELRKTEQERRERASRERRLFVLTMLPLGGALALCALYITLPAFLASENPYYAPLRPDPGMFFRLAAAPIAAGVAAAAAAGLLVSEFGGALPAWLRFMLAGLLFGVSVQFMTGLLMPVNRFFLDVTESRTAGVLADRIVDVVYGTPLFAFTFGARAIGIGILAGLVQGLGAGATWLPRSAAGRPAAMFHPVAASALLAGVIVLALFAGPPGLFRSLVSMFDGR